MLDVLVMIFVVFYLVSLTIGLLKAFYFLLAQNYEGVVMCIIMSICGVGLLSLFYDGEKDV